ncbi:hypothetical protein GIB67_039210 [Kingdonia uniflora]|uniref:Uncharacterized protein n=1 Tax=Kingdonia uniflora TaxID=39325 RepID=A0A7J7MLU5_9MAGN|nr:hypothetical protein GIB67_039210 [Kingdonia uniflora]
MEDLSLSRLLEAASDFATYPGFQNEESAKSFLDRFPLPVMISALQSKPDMPGLESTLAACLERIFKTKCGTSLIPQNMLCCVEIRDPAIELFDKSLACRIGRCYKREVKKDMMEEDAKNKGEEKEIGQKGVKKKNIKKEKKKGTETVTDKGIATEQD